MQVATIAEIRRYPVKSMLGESLDAVEIGSEGLPGDRCWAVRDEERGGIRGAKRFGGLMKLAARFPEAPAASGSSPAEVVFEDGSVAGTGDDDIAARIGAALGHEVTLWPLVPADRLDHYRRGEPSSPDPETWMREMFAREPDEPLPDVSVFPPELMEYESPLGTYFDAFPLLLLSRASLEAMASRAPDSVFDVRRFRPNLLLDDTAAGEPFPEAAWQGRRLRIGGALLQLEVRCPRCVMVTRELEELPHDPQVMRALVRETGGELGIYASVLEPGRVAVGDVCELV